LTLGFLFGILISAVQGGLFYDGPEWNNLKVTLGIPITSYGFNGVPLTISSAHSAGWTQIGSDCSNGGLYNGYRFVPEDESIAALYDAKGNVAGLQMLANKEKILTSQNGMANNYNFSGEPMINYETISGVDRIVVTAYFIDPASICTTGGRNVPSGQIGNGLWLQNGPSPNDTFIAPKKRADALSEGWNNNLCLPANGHHNFYHSNLWDEDNCASMKPVWFFYNNYDDLMGFGFTLVGYDDSPRYQHPPGAIVKFVLADGAPQCAEDIGNGIGFTNINVYFETYPQLILCL